MKSSKDHEIFISTTKIDLIKITTPFSKIGKFQVQFIKLDYK